MKIKKQWTRVKNMQILNLNDSEAFNSLSKNDKTFKALKSGGYPINKPFMGNGFKVWTEEDPKTCICSNIVYSGKTCKVCERKL